MLLRSSSRCGMRVPRESAGRSRDLERLGHRACGALRTFARVLPDRPAPPPTLAGADTPALGPPIAHLRRVERWLGVGQAPRHALRAGAPPSRDRPARRSRRRRQCRPPRTRRRDLTRLGAADDLARLAAIKEARPDAGSDQIWSGKRDGSAIGNMDKQKTRLT